MTVASPLPDLAVQAEATFCTETFVVGPINPAELRELAGVLLQDEHLAAQLDWMKDKSKDGALREAFLLELQCAAGNVRAWRIAERSRGEVIGAVVVRDEVGGLDVELLCDSTSWNDAVADEVVEPLVAWLEGRWKDPQEESGDVLHGFWSEGHSPAHWAQ
jgi:RimJ/RimL family protein N-acetyltransferase